MGDPRKTTPAELETHHAASWGWALHCCRHRREEAEEVLQASYLKLLEGKARFEGRANFRSFLFGVIRKTASEHRRRGLLHRNLLERWYRGSTPANTTTPEEQTRHQLESEQLRQALAGLSPRQRDLLHLVFYQELTVDQAAEVLGISVGSARQHYARGKARLRQHLTEPEPDHVPIRT